MPETKDEETGASSSAKVTAKQGKEKGKCLDTHAHSWFLKHFKGLLLFIECVIIFEENSPSFPFFLTG